MPLKAVFFDIDGTLVDSNEFHVRAWDEAFRHHGFSFNQDDIRTQIGQGADQLIPSLAPGLDLEAQKAIADRHGRIFRLRYLQQVKPFLHASDLVELLHEKGKQVVLASSAHAAEVDHYIDLLKIDHLITGSISGDDVKRSKPAADIFAAALALVFPMDATETLAIGDTPYDVESASRSGIKAIGLRSGGFSGQMLAEAGAAHIYASVKELFDEFHNSPLQD